MKKIKYLFITAILGLCVSFSACVDLDLDPKGVLGEPVLFNSDYGIRTYLAIIYNELPIEDFNFSVQDGYLRRDGQNWDQWFKRGPIGAGGEGSTRQGDFGGFEYWRDNENRTRPWEMIRRINNLYHAIPDYSQFHTPEYITQIQAEARLLRAWYYLPFVRMYGGVPLVDTVLDPATHWDDASLPKRATEKATWDFIYEDLKFAMENLPATSELGRANRFVAAALMSRAMLYAASVANFHPYVAWQGPAHRNGLQGMQQADAAAFYQRVIDAANFITTNGNYVLHTGANAELAFTQIFIESTGEDIFVKPFGRDATTPWHSKLTNCWDTIILPRGSGLAQNEGKGVHATWDLIRLFDMPALTELNAAGEEIPRRFANKEDLWNSPEMEARARGTYFFSGMTDPVTGIAFDYQAGVLTDIGNRTVAELTAPNDNDDSFLEGIRFRSRNTGQFPFFMDIPGFGRQQVNGAHGLQIGGDEGYSITGVGIRKYVNYNAAVEDRRLYGGWQSWKVFRYAEIKLNRAEAMYELGLITGNTAMQRQPFETDLADIRSRAGASPMPFIAIPMDISTLPNRDVGSLYPIDENRQNIRDERARELAFENHAWFDYTRWRVGHTKFQSGMPANHRRGLMALRVLSENQWVFLNHRDTQNRSISWGTRVYYRQIPGGAIARNPNIERNDD
ncbi:MAG: RagB/SusD family nutrient uptake outer membrane protein [Dysgonamonadaceae bacterium]|jgi:hypothetical protein|nr:RagB/SusD family nutrient uptake outer membrane protein [Dysgonamonadaceae bacterium]